MSRSTMLVTLAISASLLGACADTTAPRRSGSDDPTQVGDARGKQNDPQPHTIAIPLSSSTSREAQPGDDRGARGEAQPGDDKGAKEAQAADDKGRKRGGKDDAANHG